VALAAGAGLNSSFGMNASPVYPDNRDVSGASPLPESWPVPLEIRQRFGRGAGSQRCMAAVGHLLLVLHEPPGADQIDRAAAFFWRNPAGAWTSHAISGDRVESVTGLLDRYRQSLMLLEDLENRASSAADYHLVLEGAVPILRAVRGVHRTLQEAREKIPTDRDIITMRDEASALERMAELQVQDAHFGLNYIMARQAEEQTQSARRMAATAHRLNVLAAIFLPLTALTSIFGMEIHSGLPDSPVIFLAILLAGLAVGLGVGRLLARPPRTKS
jgi:hypothetical protein